METGMSADDVISGIMNLHTRGETLTKKHVKKTHPDLMKNALYYYPSWEHALQKSGVEMTH